MIVRRTSHAARPLLASSLSVAIVETVGLWFRERGEMPDQRRILLALGAAIADQVLQNPDPCAQTQSIDMTVKGIVAAVNAEHANRRAEEPCITRN